MYLYHRYVEEDFAGMADLSLSPLLAETGEAFEAGQLRRLLNANVYSVGPADSEMPFDDRWDGTLEADLERMCTLVDELAAGDRRGAVVFYQPRVKGTIGAWPVRGDADIVVATANGRSPRNRAVQVRVVELKSSSSVRTHHQLQAAVYSLLFESVLGDAEADTDVTASVVSQDPDQRGLAGAVSAAGDLDLRGLPTFELASRRNDVQLLLEAGGTFDDILLDGDGMRPAGDPPTYRIDARCDGCSKQAKCLAHSVTNKRLSLLGLTEGVQESLRELGVSDLRDLATLYVWPESQWDRQATSHVTPRPRDPDLVTEILRATDVSNLMDLAQIAHRFLREIDPSYADEWERRADKAGPWGDYLIGTGRSLPDDDPPEAFSLGYPRKSLVRVYPYVQYDYVRNRVAFLAAKVTSTRYEESNGDGVFVSARPAELITPSDAAKDREERRLLETFFDRLTRAVETVRPDLSGEGYAEEAGFLHVFPYGTAQNRALLDAVKRHPDSDAAQALRTLLGYREDIDQEVVSVLRDEFRDRHAFRYPGLGLVQTAAQFYSNESTLDWEGPRDPDATPLKRVFDLDFFETAVPYEELSDRILLQFDDGLQVPPDNLSGYYPVLGRHREVLPLEYLYAAAEFDIVQPDWADGDDEMRRRIVRYRHHRADESSPRVTLDDIDDVVHAICNAVEHIERSIRDKNAALDKQPLNLADLRENTLGVSELQSTCMEYQELEFGATRRRLHARYRTPLSQRAAAGQALPFRVTTAPEEDDPDGHYLEGSLLRSLGDEVADGVQPDTPLSLEAGSFVVMTPLTREDGVLTEDVTDPRRMTNQVLGRVTGVDTVSGTVRVSLNWVTNQRREKFKPNHVGWTSDPDDDYNRQYIEAGMPFVLDAALDDFVAHRAHHALRAAPENDVHNRLVNLYDDAIADALRVDTPLFDQPAVRTFLDAFDDVMPESTNTDQRSFVVRASHTVAALQGPPGTGKTSYASAPALLARAYASSADAFSAVATAHSHNAVDEIARAVGTAQRRLAAEGILEDTTLIRVRPDSASGELPDNVHEYHYYEDAAALESLFERHVLADESPGPLLVFTTPVTLRNLIHTVRETIDEAADSAETLMMDGRARLFDLLLIDEASMMDLPLMFLSGAFLGRDKQLLLVGDHRQMQPIQSHDWEAETRRTIEENTPAVSALDFLRFLRGDEDSNFERLDRDPPTWPDRDAVIPMDRLRTTYRLPPAMAVFETELFYHRDGIQLESGAPGRRIPDVRGDHRPDWLNAALDPTARVTVLVHDDPAFTKDSPAEAYLAETLLGALPVVDANAADGELTAGVVVPFRLMRRRLQGRLSVTVDTVERFQGGERDVMVLAMTASNQGYVNQLSEFILDANRFNVGASRMKRKLFIVVSKAVFRAVSGDPRKYEQQKAWKQLYQSVIAGQAPEASVEFTSEQITELGARSLTVDVYTGYSD